MIFVLAAVTVAVAVGGGLDIREETIDCVGTGRPTTTGTGTEEEEGINLLELFSNIAAPSPTNPDPIPDAELGVIPEPEPLPVLTLFFDLGISAKLELDPLFPETRNPEADSDSLFFSYSLVNCAVFLRSACAIELFGSILNRRSKSLRERARLSPPNPAYA